jgi:hypothetical protein
MYIKINNDNTKIYPYNLHQLFVDNPNVSFPVNLTEQVLDYYGIYNVTPTPKPVVDHTQTVTQSEPVYDGTKWVQVWEVQPADPDVINDRVSQKWDRVRDYRNLLLSESDWTQMPDSPLIGNVAWVTYRQLLRDITNSPDPFTIVWPDIPN